jgi:hypothetical protein
VIGASRLARYGREWHALIGFCGLIATIIVDEDGIYDPLHPNNGLINDKPTGAIGVPRRSQA